MAPDAYPSAPAVVPDAPLSTGVARVGEVPKTNAPLPVSPVTADARFALEGVARKVATPEPKPLTPVLTGRPVQLVSVPAEGVPISGVTSVGEADIKVFTFPSVTLRVEPFADCAVSDTSTTGITSPVANVVVAVKLKTVVFAILCL
jgi:hypothetical protein